MTVKMLARMAEQSLGHLSLTASEQIWIIVDCKIAMDTISMVLRVAQSKIGSCLDILLVLYSGLIVARWICPRVS